MTPRRLAKLQEHWVRHPRLEWLAAAYLGYKPPPPPEERPQLADLFASFGVDPSRPGERITG